MIKHLNCFHHNLYYLLDKFTKGYLLEGRVMSVDIEAIKFNHDPNSASHDAFNIRKNKSQFIDVPEWVRGVSIKPEDSPSAYSIKDTMGNTITIQAKFKRTNPEIDVIEVRATDPTYGERVIGCLYKILVDIGVKFILPPPEIHPANILGSVKARQVEFQPDGYTDFETFELYRFDWSKFGECDLQFERGGVCTNITRWEWECRLNSNDSWIKFATTYHKIYIVLETPKLPWEQTPYIATNDQLPWTDVLDYSCIWGEWAKDRDEGAKKITERVNALGPFIIKYDASNGANFYNTHKSDTSPGKFYCSDFLERLSGDSGRGGKVNCADCAAITSTFANILGCDLWQSKMHEKESLWDSRGFELNEILAIGHPNWEAPFDGRFRYHEVAWKGNCGVNDELFDACLKVDGDDNPSSAPHSPLLPVNMKFGTCGLPMEYRDRLTSYAGCPKCNPQPSSKTHRKIE